MGELSWPSDAQLNYIRNVVSQMAGQRTDEVQVVVSPYRICPLGAHIDHQGGTVCAMTIDKGILLGFVPSGDSQVHLRSEQFRGEVRFRVDEIQHPKPMSGTNLKVQSNGSSTQHEDCDWGNYARGAQYALQSRGHRLSQGIIGFICGSKGLDSSGLSSSAAVGIAYLLAFERANNLLMSPAENIEYDRLIENEYLGLKNGILDQSAILLSSHGCLTSMNCKTKKHELICFSKLQKDIPLVPKAFKILLAFSGLKQALTSNPGYNRRVEECQEAAKFLLDASGNGKTEPVLSDVHPEVYEAYKHKLETNLAKRAEHYFSENMRVLKGIETWASGDMEKFGELISASGLSSIRNYECGAEPLIQLYEILLRAPGVFGARFSGAGFRGCCLAFVDTHKAAEAASFVRGEYSKRQPKLASKLNQETAVLICDVGDCARVI
ncbi:galacturonokinase isoform X1 [Rhodamnia argentea]|uniref:Galacturonokinase isoform X1 n=1 Tax=Rhodamnia argentea TaxID=178133 RepID=A0ABM3HA39_9MYRT|nr:galacturonokinase isoform X1 [Rhodamnia argentea]